VIGLTVLAAVAVSAWRIRPVDRPHRADAVASPAPATSPAPPPPALSDQRLQQSADELLALVDPERPENAYFSDFARDRLRWMVREYRAGRLQVAFLTDASNGPLPPDVLMAAWKAGDTPTIFIAKPRFLRFLIETGATEPPFTLQQKNDFALALVHEIVHLQNPDADPRDLELRPAEESRVWREVNLQVVRPLRSLNQPIHRRFRDVDDALRACRDELPCAPLLRLVRTAPVRPATR
jgi:hypothetical protein